MENGFQVAKFLFEVQKTSNIFFALWTINQLSFKLPVLALEGFLGGP